jgi:hypothetical protein
MRSHRVVRTAAVAATLAALAPAGTAMAQDLRSPDTREAAAAAAPPSDLRSPDVRDVAGRTVVPARAGDLRSPDVRDAAVGRGPHTAPTVMVVGVPQSVAAGDGMDWADAGIGAGGALALVTVALGGAFVLGRRRHGVPFGRGIASAG